MEACLSFHLPFIIAAMDKIYKLRAFCTASLSSIDLSGGFTRLLGDPISRSVDRISMQRGFGQFPVTRFEHGRQGLHQLVHLQANSKSITNGEGNESKNGDMQAPKPPNFSFSQWLRWVVGSLFTLLLPFLNLKWGTKIQAIEVETELVVEEVEKVAEVVEKVAEEAEKVAEDVAESLPNGNNNLKQAALWVEKASKATAHDAQLTQDFIQKVEEVEHDLHDLETIVDPIFGKIIHGGP